MAKSDNDQRRERFARNLRAVMDGNCGYWASRLKMSRKTLWRWTTKGIVRAEDPASLEKIVKTFGLRDVSQLWEETIERKADDWGRTSFLHKVAVIMERLPGDEWLELRRMVGELYEKAEKQK